MDKSTWLEQHYEPAAKKTAERGEYLYTTSGIEIQPLYTADDLPPEAEVHLGYPGLYPFTRGVQPTMYRGRLWSMRQYAGYATAEESNARYHYLLKQGTTGLSVAFDLPTQLGYDSDAVLAEGEVGKVGVAISSLEDMEVLLSGLPLDRISTSMTINATAGILLALYIAVAKKQGIPPEKLSGTVQNDILKEYIARGTYIYPPAPSMRLITDIFSYCSEQLPRWNTISISGYHIREAGSSAAQELAFTLANACAYVNAALKAGLSIDSFARQLSFFFNSHSNFFEEIAKFRAARRMWAKLMREQFGAKDPRSWMLRFHTQTAGSTLTAQQVDNNIIRTTIEALAGVLGGTQSLHTNSRDEALSLPSEESVQIALRTQQIIAYESGVADTIDPLAGSYFIESLTDELEHRALSSMAEIHKLGGSINAIGYMQREIHQSAYTFQQELEKQQRILVGINKYVVEEKIHPRLLKVDPAIARRQSERLAALRARRDASQVQQALSTLQKAARGTDNTMPFILQAVESYATLGEISDALRTVFGEQQQEVEI